VSNFPIFVLVSLALINDLIFSDNTRLTALKLKKNKLTSLARHAFPEDVTSFVELSLVGNNIRDLPKVIKDMENLEKLSLCHNPIKVCLLLFFVYQCDRCGVGCLYLLCCVGCLYMLCCVSCLYSKNSNSVNEIKFGIPLSESALFHVPCFYLSQIMFESRNKQTNYIVC